MNDEAQRVMAEHLKYKMTLQSYKHCLRDCIKDGASKDPGEQETSCWSNCLKREELLYKIFEKVQK